MKTQVHFPRLQANSALIRRSRPSRLPTLFVGAALLTCCLLPDRVRADLTNGLVGWWRFDEGSGTTATDSSENGNHGSIHGATWTTNGYHHTALQFDGNVYVEITNSPTLDIAGSNPLTVALWANASRQVTMHILGKREGCSPVQYQMVDEYGYGGLLFGGDGCAHSICVNTGTHLPASMWTHLAVTFDGAKFRFYVNGVEAITGDGKLGDKNSANLRIGKSGEYPNGFRGSLDDVRLYNRALSADEIRGLVQVASIAGTVSYPGAQTGLIWIEASNSLGSSFTATITSPTNYALHELPGGTNYWLSAFRDSNTNGAKDYWEATGVYLGNPILLTTNIFNANITLADPEVDSDRDGLPDWWEIKYCLNPSNAVDAVTVPLGDRLTHLQKFTHGLDPLTPDSDGDELTDYAELFIYHSDPLNPDSNGNGVNDGAEVASGRDPTFNGTRYYYDKNDRLVGAECAKGLSLGYQYDGNGNIVRQVYLGFEQSTNGLPALWKFLNGLSVTDFEGTNSAFADADGDGWSNYQEWLVDSSPTSPTSRPAAYGLAGTSIASTTWPFAVSDFVVGVGQLDGSGAEEIVIGADGNPGTTTNFLLVLSESPTGWTTQPVPIGAVGITSIAVGQLSNAPSPAIYFGSRQAGSTGTVVEVRWVSNVWAKSFLALGNTNEAAYVLGVDPAVGVFAELSVSTAPASSLFAISPSGASWTADLQSGWAATRALGGFEAGTSGPAGPCFRLLTQGGIEVGAPIPGPRYGLVGYWPFDDGNAADRSGNGLDGQLYGGPMLVSGRFGDALQFDGSNDRVVVPYNSLLDLPTGLTISLWVKADAWNGTSQLFGRVTDEHYRICSLFGVGSELRFWLEEKGQDRRSVSISAPPTNEWHHVAATWNGTTMQLFLDGDLKASDAALVTMPPTPIALGIGARDNSTYPEYFDGTLDEIRLYDRALSTQEITDLYQGAGEEGRLDEPTGVQIANWRGSAFAVGRPRSADQRSLFYTAVDDENANGVIDAADTFVLAEYLLPASASPPFRVTRTALSGVGAPSYGQACVDYQNTANDVLFTGQPDGRVFAWIATNSTGPLQRQLFSAHHVGKAWHAMAGVKTLEPGEGLVGLRVDPTNQNTCEVVFWSPESELWAPPDVAQTAPSASILISPALGNGLATNQVTVWDDEGNASLIEMQFRLVGSTAWETIMAMVGVDGTSYGAVSTHPTGTTHQVVWNAAQVFGAGYTNDLKLRARATDVTLTGNWSPEMAYRVEISLNAVNNPPQVTITQPTNGAVFIEPATITLLASASDVEGPIVKVEFFQGTNQLGEALTSPPYQYIWSNVPAGVYGLYARATDSEGATNYSSPVIITNKPPGFVKLESPQGAGGYFSMLITGEAGQVYDVQTSSNLTAWATVKTVTNTTGSVLFTESLTNETQRYYRARVVR